MTFEEKKKINVSSPRLWFLIGINLESKSLEGCRKVLFRYSFIGTFCLNFYNCAIPPLLIEASWGKYGEKWKNEVLVVMTFVWIGVLFFGPIAGLIKVEFREKANFSD